MHSSNSSLPVPTKVYKAIEESDINALSLCTETDIRPILPCLVRMSLIAPLDHSEECSKGRRVILRILSGIEAVNALVALLSIDFTTLEIDVKKEQSLRQKLGTSSQTESVLIQNLANGLALEFECSDPTRRLRLLLSEILLVMAQMKEIRQDYYMKHSELFDNECYLEEVSDVLCIALAELPSLLSPTEVAETLLHLANGPSVICKIVANQPDCFREVVSGLILNGEKQDEDSVGGMIRLQAVRLLCEMNPSQAQNARGLCVENCVMPALAVFLSLDIAKTCELAGPTCGLSNVEVSGLLENDEADRADIVSFVTGLLLSADQQQRNWFCQFIKATMRQRKADSNCSALNCLRTELIDRLRTLLLFNNTVTLPDFKIIKAIALLRLYCALRSLATIKFNEEKEVSLLLQLVTCTVPPTPTGVRFVSVALCFLIACPSVIGSHENEKKAAEWIRWLVKEESYFAGATGGSSASFGAMLLLMAIHFHLNQLTAVTDLASTALGMKIASRSNLARIKYIFTHDIFTEQVIAAHSVKVLVTKNLNANMPGLHPIHCIYHQLKSRMFSKHKILIKNWIYKQICECSTPLHPTMPVLIEAFVNSVLLAANKTTNEMVNDPITESEILDVFSLSTFTGDANAGRLKCKTHRKMWTNNRLNCKSTSARFAASGHNNANIFVERKVAVASVMTSQLLLLYYLLVYEDVRLNNAQQLAGVDRPKYSAHLFAQLPIRYLLSNAQREQKMFAGVFSCLLKLLVSHYPQLCLLQDWLYDAPSADDQISILPPRLPFNPHTLTQALGKASEDPCEALVLMNRMLQLSPEQLWPMANPFVDAIKQLLKPDVPRKILDCYHTVWLHLNSLFPRRLWAMTVECLRVDRDPHSASWIPITEDDIVLDPLHVLRCDSRVFRCVPILKIVIYMLDVYLLSSRSYLSQHLQSNPGPEGNPAQLEEEKEKLKNALVLTQESAAMQILLESTVAGKQEKLLGENLLLQEVRSIVCSFLHHTFIKDTTLAKLIHFQGYPKDLVGPLVQGVPSMHIAVGLNWIPELLQIPDLQKQMFALELTANLALQNAMPSTLHISRLAINTVATLLSVLSENSRLWVMERSLVPMLQIGRALPVLLDDVLHLLVTFGRVSNAHLALLPAGSPTSISNMYEYNLLDEIATQKGKCDDVGSANLPREEALCRNIKWCFAQLISVTSNMSGLY